MVPAVFFHDESEATSGGFLEVDSFYGPAVIYFVAIVWAFTAVAIISDVFMTSIEVITSAEKELEVDDELTGRKKKYRAKVWNDTVANLTLMALGSSAPEIMLSLIELLNNRSAGWIIASMLDALVFFFSPGPFLGRVNRRSPDIRSSVAPYIEV